MLRRFHLDEPETVKEASSLLARFGESAKVYAGGTELLLAMKEGLIHFEHLINVKKIPHLSEIKRDNGVIRIGALATHRKIESNDELRDQFPALARLESNVANVRVREVGTLGGNLCFAEPHADPGTLLLVLNATLTAEKADSKREIPIERFFVDAYETCLEADEVVTEIRIPEPPEKSAAAYLKFGYLERPSVGAALCLNWDGSETITEAKIAVGAAGPKPKRAEEAEALLRGKNLKEASKWIERAGEIAGRAAEAMSDLHGSAEYKEHITKILLKRALRQVTQKPAPGKRN